MKLKTLLSGIEVLESAVPMDTEVRGVSYDSRHTAPGDVFVAITGYETDGHKYIAAALEKGAAAVLCERAPEKGAPYIRVADSRLALALASKNFFGDPCSEMKMIGITGTNGKTTSAHLLKHVLEEAVGAKVGLIGTSGNMIGGEELPAERTTPESYELQALLRRMADEGCTHVVMEVSSHSLVLHRVAGLRFAAGIFTNLTRDHLDFHVTMEAYAEAKAMMLPMCAACAVNLDDDWARFMIDAAPCPVITFSEKYNEADLVAKDLRFSPSGVKFCAVRTNEIQRVSLGIPGRFSVYNAMGVLACCRILGLNLESCASALATAEGVRGRMEVVPSFPDCTVLIDYAHNEAATESLMETLKAYEPHRMVVVFGCGGGQRGPHRPCVWLRGRQGQGKAPHYGGDCR